MTTILEPAIEIPATWKSLHTSLVQLGKDVAIVAKKVVDLVNEDGEFVEKFSEHYKVEASFLQRLYKVGMKRLHEDLFFDSSCGGRLLARLDYGLQEAYLKKPLPVLVYGPGGWDTLHIMYSNLSREQARQVLDNQTGVLRTVTQQRTWLAANATNIKALQEATPEEDAYRVTKKQLQILRPCSLTKKELLRILSSMED